MEQQLLLQAGRGSKAPIPPAQTQTDKIINCATSWSISENELMDMRMNNYVELELEEVSNQHLKL